MQLHCQRFAPLFTMQLYGNEWHVLGDSMTITSPAPAGNRMAVLDVVRGVAILGTFGANVWIFTDPAGPTGLLGAEGTAGSLLLFLANGKFLALLTLMSVSYTHLTLPTNREV